MLRDRISGQQNNDRPYKTAAFLLLLTAVSAAAYFQLVDIGVTALADKVQTYMFGKGAWLPAAVMLAVAVRLLMGMAPASLNKRTIGFFLLMLCLLGTAHHIFVPVGSELYPSTLPDGGGLAGGVLVLALHKLAGDTGTAVVLGAGWLIGLLLVLPLKAIHSRLKGLIFSGGDDDDFSEDEENAEKAPVQKREQPRSLRKPVIMPKRSDAARGAGRRRSVYDQEEFSSFRDGLKKDTPFRRILSRSVYDEEPVREAIEQDPIQIPEWEEKKSTNPVVLRPIISYDRKVPVKPVQEKADLPLEFTAAFEEGGEDAGKSAETETGVPEQAAEQPARTSAVINNFYRRPELGRTADKPAPDVHKAAEPAENVSSVREAEPEKPRTVAIYDSAEKTAAPAAAAPEAQETASSGSACGYILPPVELLGIPQRPDPSVYQNDIMQQCSVLEQTLADFRVKAKVVAVTRGPSVTRFELEPAPGVKVSSVVNLADDIALRLAAPGVRIEAPIPGKSAIGIEAPNTKNDTVCFREVVDTDVVRSKPSKLCIGLGKDISGNIIPADLAKMPHLLVAGSTGSGKSVCINTIIAGLLYKARPDEVKLILVDPKVVELSNYNGIPHLLTPVVTEPKKAASALHWAVAEMERRYKMFADSHVREITSYNEKAQEKMPYIVIIIDELSDLMMVAKVDVEEAILRLAQKARAAGIHLILATQRPSVDVITGIVKANIPSRIAFAVSSQTDSRTILDMGGAEKLLGKGDMLFYPIGMNKPVRVQGAFVSDSELNKIVDFIIKQSIPVNYSEEVTQQALECDGKNAAAVENTGSPAAEDELFEDALSLVLDMGQASASMLQRRFRIGYTRAARLVDTMEELGIVGQSVGSKPREVIMSRQEAEERFLDKQ